MKVVDLNLLIYAVNADAPQHARALQWWEDTLNGEEQVGLAWPVVLGFLRICTRPGVLPKPLAPDRPRSRRNLDQPLAHPAPDAGDRHWTVLRPCWTGPAASAISRPTRIWRRSPSSTTRRSARPTPTSALQRSEGDEPDRLRAPSRPSSYSASVPVVTDPDDYVWRRSATADQRGCCPPPRPNGGAARHPPVCPTAPMRSPFRTTAPSSTAVLDRCAKYEYKPRP